MKFFSEIPCDEDCCELLKFIIENSPSFDTRLLCDAMRMVGRYREFEIVVNMIPDELVQDYDPIISELLRRCIEINIDKAIIFLKRGISAHRCNIWETLVQHITPKWAFDKLRPYFTNEDLDHFTQYMNHQPSSHNTVAS
jgi:hypothetical protein